MKDCFDLRAASKNYQLIFVNVSLFIFHSDLEEVLILQRISEAPFPYRSNPSLWPNSYVTFQQYFNVVQLCW